MKLEIDVYLEVCFTLFFNDTYIDGKQGLLTIRNLKMVQK